MAQPRRRASLEGLAKASCTLFSVIQSSSGKAAA
jgi:hypothetical protein